jgi:hypothetical protein
MSSTAEDSSADAPDGDRPTDPGLPLDAVANLRLLGEVQRRGLEAANQVIARLTERTNAAGTGPAGANGSNQMTAMTEAFVESLATAVSAMAPGARVPSAPSAGHDPGTPEVLSARGVAGAEIGVELWVHNYTDDPATAIEIHLTDLIRADGALLSSTCVSVRPDQPFDLSAASSRSVRLTIATPPDAAAGRYRAIVTAAHLADLWLVLELELTGTGDVTTTTQPPAPDPDDPTP